MKGAVYIITEDYSFAQALSNNLKILNITITNQVEDTPHPLFANNEIDVVLLDIRQQIAEAVALLRWIREHAPNVEVITLNTTDRVQASIEAMRAGAADELTVPLDTETLKAKVMVACQRSRAKKPPKSLFQKFSQTMAASAFAQAGEFDTAMEVMNWDKKPKKDK
jgi:DNA-binding NtrC family response regulator